MALVIDVSGSMSGEPIIRFLKFVSMGLNYF